MLISDKPGPPSNAPDFAGICVLVLDDDPNMRSLISGALTRCGCQNILRSGVPTDALLLFAHRKIDLVICDWMMEPMSGLQFLQELRRPARRLTVPVIMLTANSDAVDIALARKFDISGWLVKPIALPKLIERIGIVLGLSTKDLPSNKELADEVEGRAEQYLTRLVDDLRALDEALAAMQQTKGISSLAAAAQRGPHWTEVDHIMHNIKGQAGSFGYDLVTSVAELGQTLTRPMSGNIDLVYHHHDAVHRCVVAIAQAMRLVMQNKIQGDGAQVGVRLMHKLQSFTEQVTANLIATAETS